MEFDVAAGTVSVRSYSPWLDAFLVDDGAVQAPSNWQLVHGDLWQTSNIYGPDNQAMSERLGTRCMWDGAGSSAWSDYTLSTTVGTTDDDGLGVVFRAQADDFYKFDMDKQRNFRKLFRQVGGNELTLASEGQSYAQLEDLSLRIHAEGASLSVSLGGELLFGGPVVDAALSSGSIGWTPNARVRPGLSSS